MTIITPSLESQNLFDFAFKHNKEALRDFDRIVGNKSFRDYENLFIKLFPNSSLLNFLTFTIIIQVDSLDDCVILSKYLKIDLSEDKKFICACGTVIDWLNYCTNTNNQDFAILLYKYLRLVAPIISDFVIIEQGKLKWKQ